MTFRVGQPVICIQDNWCHPLLHLVPHLPVAKRKYVIRSIETFHNGTCGLRFEGMVNPLCEYRGIEPGFNVTHFRPLVERKNDGDAFVANLKKIALPVVSKEVCGNDYGVCR